MRVAKKKVLLIGILFLFIGSVFSLSHMYSLEKLVWGTSELAGLSTYQYNVTGFFNRNERLMLELPSVQPPFQYIPFNVSIVGPDGTQFVIEVEFAGDPVQDPDFYIYTVLKNEGCLEKDEGILGGVTTQTGNYTAILDGKARYLYGDPIPSLSLWKSIRESRIEYPYKDRLLPGMALVFVGGGISVWAFIPKKTGLTRKPKKR